MKFVLLDTNMLRFLQVVPFPYFMMLVMHVHIVVSFFVNCNGRAFLISFIQIGITDLFKV